MSTTAETTRQTKSAYHQKLREEVIEAYGGPRCKCCGETEPLFLQLDHIYNDGDVRRKAYNNTYSWAKRNNYPSVLQVLCSNCNQGKRRNGGTCPHELAHYMRVRAAKIRRSQAKTEIIS